MTAKPRVSIVIDNYNYAQFLREAVESALAQTYARMEVVVVDDGSTDGSREVIAGFGDAVIPVLKANGGQASAINAGFAASSGDLVLFLDADDFLHPEAVERSVARHQPGMAKLHFRLDAVGADGHPLGFTVPTAARTLDAGDVVPRLLDEGRYVTPTMSGNMFPRSVLERLLPVPEAEFRISADGYLVTSAPFHGPVIAVDEILGGYRVHGSNWWAPERLDAARLRDYLRHDFSKYRCVYDGATAAGLSVTGSLTRRDQFHLRTRLASLRYDPDEHPVPSDTRPGLAVSGVVATLRSDLDARRRALFAAWFLAVALGPSVVARPLVRYLYVPHHRPAWTRRVRALLRGSRC